MKKKITVIGLAVSLALNMMSCASLDRYKTDIKSDINGGLQRTIKVFTANGGLLAEYEGKIDIDCNSGGYVKFDYDGKRYIYYNCFVESIADID